MTGFLTLATWRAVATPLHIVAIGSTAFRICHRHRKRQLWWDDYWAAISLCFDAIYMITPWLRDDEWDPRPSKQKRITVFWLSYILFPLVVWTSRISIGMSIGRLVPPKTRARHALYALNGFFSLMCAVQLAWKIRKCTRNTSWHNNRAGQCYLGSGVGVISLITDLIADALLVVIPLHILWHVKLPRGQRRLILSIFASSVLSSLSGVVYAAFVFRFPRSRSSWAYRVGLAANIQVAVALTVCNLLVIVTYIYCLFWKSEEDEVSEPSETRSKPTETIPQTKTLVLTEISDTPPSQSVNSYPVSETAHRPSVFWAVARGHSATV